MKNGGWIKETSGGCRNFPTFVNNPQFVITLDEDDDGDGKCSCIVALMQKNRRKQKKMGIQDLCIGFSVYKVCTILFKFLKNDIMYLYTCRHLLMVLKY